MDPARDRRSSVASHWPRRGREAREEGGGGEGGGGGRGPGGPGGACGQAGERLQLARVAPTETLRSAREWRGLGGRCLRARAARGTEIATAAEHPPHSVTPPHAAAAGEQSL